MKRIPPVPVVLEDNKPEMASVHTLIKPKQKRPVPPGAVIETRGQVGIHTVALVTRGNKPASMEIIWTPGRPPASQFLPAFQTKFRELQMKHAQKLADITQQTVTFKEII